MEVGKTRFLGISKERELLPRSVPENPRKILIPLLYLQGHNRLCELGIFFIFFSGDKFFVLAINSSHLSHLQISHTHIYVHLDLAKFSQHKLIK